MLTTTILPFSAPECDPLTSPSYINFALSLSILVGILVSYLPQHHRIVTRGTSEGISPGFLLLGVTSGTCAFANIIILSRGVLGCCGKGIGGFNCFAASLGVLQVGIQWTCFGVILLLFLIYFPRDEPLEAPATAHVDRPRTKTALIVTVLCVLHFAAVVALTFYFSFIFPDSLSSALPVPSPQLTSWANFLGVQSAILASLQYIPQLYTTWTLKHVGSLSIPMMCIQTPGSFVWAISLASREGTSWSSWMTYVVTGVLQGALLAMCVTWEIRDNRGKKHIAAPSDSEERRPLLQENEVS